MALLSQHLSGLMPIPNRPNHAVSVVAEVPSTSPVIGPQARQSQILEVAPAMVSAAALFAPDFQHNPALRDREQHELQSLLRTMQGIETPPPKGEHVDLLVPRPTKDDP
ncbi:MAG: hypothetical protein ABJN34_10700 [Litoreibacter sp.]|uniref:hypothetical protein n=1 Tax=Litoreibacter sp. TaxID=1969459 RepID=UPI003298E07C